MKTEFSKHFFKITLNVLRHMSVRSGYEMFMATHYGVNESLKAYNSASVEQQ